MQKIQKCVWIEWVAIILLTIILFQMNNCQDLVKASETEVIDQAVTAQTVDAVTGYNTQLLTYSTEIISDVAQIAMNEDGNDYEKYCEWWGWSDREEWCAVFVCWAASQAGYTPDVDYINWQGANSDIGCYNDSGAGAGSHARFHNKYGRYYTLADGYLPQSGDLIYFDWESDNGDLSNLVMDHVGIVIKVENGIIYTVEGNRKDSINDDETDLVRICEYSILDESIVGFSSFE